MREVLKTSSGEGQIEMMLVHNPASFPRSAYYQPETWNVVGRLDGGEYALYKSFANEKDARAYLRDCLALA